MGCISEENKEKIINEELIFRCIKSSGPGGQNINKRNTKVQLVFNIIKSKYLSSDQKNEIRKSFPEEAISIISHEERFQKQNKASAIKKLFLRLNKFLLPKKERTETTLPRAEKEKRYVDKTRQGQKKKIRSKKISLDNEE